MPTEVKQLIGAINLDDPIEVLGKGFHRAARNIEFDGTPPNRRVKTRASVLQKTNALLPNTGVNKTICRKYDSKTRRIFFLNYNSSGKHGIYVYNTIPATFQRLVEVGVNTIGDPLQFTAESHVNIDIIYGDNTQGDILYWVDSLGRPSKINITRALASGYGNIQRSFLDVAKEPADIPPYVVYENDSSNTVNNLRKRLFRVKTRWVFDDNDKSITSSQSQMPLPPSAFDQSVDTDPTKNCRLAITYQTGPSNVKKIEILVANSLGNVMSDFYLVASIEKAVENIPNDDIATYLFYNDKGYNNILEEESNQLQDYVPQATEAQTLLNGNVLAYGNITEGFPNLANFSFGGNTSSVSSGQDLYYKGNYFTNLIASQDGKSGFGSGNIHIVVRGAVISPSFSLDTYTVYMTDGTNITYTLSTGDDAAAVIEGLRVNAISKGYTIVSVSTNDLYVFKTNISLARVFITSDFSYNTLSNGSLMAYDWSSKYGFGLVYFDQKDRTNGAVYTNGFSVSTIPFGETGPFEPYTPKLTATIYHQPPDWAYYFQWVRTKNLSKSKIQQWISDRTYKDTTVLTGLIKYAYISIESLNAFVLANPGSPLGYGFTAGDRVRFMKRYNGDGSTANLYGNTRDYEIVASVTNPEINGEVKSGQFVKIILPSVDGTFDFGTDGFANYFLELYTPAQSVTGGLDLYYEYGERYAIGNPTLATRFHQGMLQNQTGDYSLPATYEFTKGDFYIRNRSVQTGNVYTWNIVGGSLTAGRILFGLNFVGSTYSDPNITSQSVTLANISGNTPSGGISPGSDTRWFQRAILVSTFRARLTITLNFTTTVVGDTWRIFWLNRYNEREYIATLNNSTAGTYTVNIDTSKTLEDDRVFLIAEGQERPVVILSSQMTWSVDRVIEQRMIDQNFSDYFISAVNSNGRSFIYDVNANRVNFPNMYRWSLAYQEDTNINNTSRFYGENFDVSDRSKGAIKKLASMDKRLVFFLERKCGWTGVYDKNITNSSGSQQLITTDVIINPNNIQYYAGEFGVGNQPTSVVQSGYVYYFVDPVKNKILRLSMDGVTDLTELYKVQTWGSQNLPKYLNPGTYAFGGAQKVLGVFNNRPDNVGEYLLLAQGTATTAGETFSFEEKYNAFPGHIDMDCDALVCAENTLFAFRAGQLWQTDPTNPTFCNFFGVQKEATITIPFNEQMVIKKVYNAIAYEANQTWGSITVGDVQTDTVNSQTFLRQQSRIFVQDYDVSENPSRYASFNRDVNSMTDPAIALWEGDYLTGRYILVKLTASFTGFCTLFAPYITYQLDPRNL